MPRITHLLVFTIPLAVLIFFLPTWQSLSNLWLKMDYAYSYGFICVALGLLTAYQNRKQTLTIKAKPSYLAFILLIGASFTWFLSHYLKIQIGAQLILVPIIFFIIASLYGKKVALSQTVPLLYLLLSIPVWDYLNTALQSLTTQVATAILETTSLAFFFEGNRITLPYGVIEIAGGCSGLRYFLVSLALTLFYSQQRSNTLKTTLLLFTVGAIFGLIANWARVTLLILIGYQSQMQSELMDDHEAFGWIVYLIVAIPAGIIMNYIERHSKEKPAIETNTTYNFIPSNKIIACCLLSLSVGPALYLFSQQAQSTSQPSYALNPEPPNSSWIKQSNYFNNWTPNFEGAEQIITQTFTQINKKRNITVIGLFYGEEKQGQELVSEQNTLADPKIWNFSNTTSEYSFPSSVPVVSAVIRNTKGQTKLVYAYYEIGNYQTNKLLFAKLSQLQSITTPEILKGLFAYSIDCENQCERESATLSSFIDDYASNASIKRQTR